MPIKQYLSNHQIIQIGYPPDGYICCDVIVDDPDEFLLVVQESECYISQISWWDYIEKGSLSPIGYGGTEDPNNPEYYFSETDMSQDFNSLTSLEEYCSYISHIQKQYSQHRIVPSFDIRKRDKGTVQERQGDGSVVS